MGADQSIHGSREMETPRHNKNSMSTQKIHKGTIHDKTGTTLQSVNDISKTKISNSKSNLKKTMMSSSFVNDSSDPQNSGIGPLISTTLIDLSMLKQINEES